MDTLTIKPMEADEEGWVEVVLGRQAVAGGDHEDAETIGYIRVVEGTADGPHTWWDVRRIEDNGVKHKRFIDYDAALLGLAFRHAAPDVKTLGW